MVQRFKKGTFFYSANINTTPAVDTRNVAMPTAFDSFPFVQFPMIFLLFAAARMMRMSGGVTTPFRTAV